MRCFHVNCKPSLRLFLSTRSFPGTAAATTTTKKRLFSSSRNTSDQTVTSLEDGILTITMNRPNQLNAWTEPMMKSLENDFRRAAEDDAIGAVILTGAGKYYCAGVNLSGIMKPMHPASLHKLLVSTNKRLFDQFIQLPVPIIAAVNGPAIGASVTSATLCDAIVADSSATFSTPFHRLGIPPEGCSSVHFTMIMGEENAERMIGPEGWAPDAEEASAIGMVESVVPEGGDLLAVAKSIAIEKMKFSGRKVGPTGGQVEEFLRVNADESVDLADAFFSSKFLEGQRAFLSSKGKTAPAAMFSALKVTRPLWSLLLPPVGHGKST